MRGGVPTALAFLPLASVEASGVCSVRGKRAMQYPTVIRVAIRKEGLEAARWPGLMHLASIGVGEREESEKSLRLHESLRKLSRSSDCIVKYSHSFGCT